ncbi:alanine--tRNA ligase-related protein [Streptomyces sp. NPDC013181]|uniref:alanine--tRNA ligase-related protein n=1 Tax=unclassified Streptomyces TaxID=2593676 RepID=UPI0036A6C370
MPDNAIPDRLAAARAARDRLEEWGSGFADWFLAAGSRRLAPEPAVPTTDRTILFTNSAVVPFKPFIRGDESFADQWVTVRQPCIRSHNLRATFREDFHTEFVLHFEMLGAMAPAGDLDAFTEAVAGYFGTGLGLAAGQVAFKVAEAHHDLSGAWQRAWAGPVGYDGEPADFYSWTFGDEGMTGRGATFCLVQPDGSWRDLGNLIAFEWQGRTVAYGFGIGLETLAAGLTAARWVIDTTPEGTVCLPKTPQQAKLADLLGLAAEFYRVGVVPAKRAQGYIMRKALVYLERLAGQLGVPDELLIEQLAAIGAVNAPGTDMAERFRDDLAQQRKDAASTRSVDLSFLCDAALEPELLCGAAEDLHLPELLGLEARVSDTWRGSSLPDGRQSVTLTLDLTSAAPLDPARLRTVLRGISEQLSTRFSATLRGSL